MAKKAAPLVALVSFLLAMILPMPPFFIDIAIVFSLALSFTVYLRAATINEWDELKTFPSILLLSAIFRIALNIATTRKILQDGEPGQVIEASGSLIASSNIFVGFVIFIILFIVQFIVVSQGATRLAEVRARFTLDGLPMKQMSIDNDLNNGLISNEEAKEKRKKLDMQVDFYGNMDGAGKFIKGDVTASIILFLVNIIFGFIIGIVVLDMSFTEAAELYSILTIGDGLVSQICSLLLAIAGAVVMTRVYGDEEKNLAEDILGDLTFSPYIVKFVAVVFAGLSVLGLFTDLPFLPFLILSAGLFYLASKREKILVEEEEKERSLEIMQEQQEIQIEKDRVEVETEVEAITLELGIALIPIVGEEANGETLQDKIKIMRQVITKELGVKIPQIHVIDNSSLFPYTKYRIKVKDNLVAEGDLRTGKLLALKTPYVVKDVDGEPTKDPIFGEDAIWIGEGNANEAKDNGYMIYDPLSIISTHLNEILRRHLYEMLERQDVQDLVDHVSEKRKVLLKEIEEEKIQLAIIQGVLKNLLRESISIRDLPAIIEAIIDGSRIVNSMYDPSNIAISSKLNTVDEITTIVRERISKYICEKNKNDDGKLYVVLLDPKLEKQIETFPRYDGYYLKLSMEQEQSIVSSLIQEVQRSQMAGIEPVLFTSRNNLRFAFARMIHKYNIPISVLSANELVQGITVEQVGLVAIEE
jgi:flagellar biosynthesis protein FlhA